MRTVVTETVVYTFDELSPAAQEKACEQWSTFLWNDSFGAESVERVWLDLLEDRGWVDPLDLTFDLYSPGGEPAWAGVLPVWSHEGHDYRVLVSKRHTGGGSYHMVVDLVPVDGDSYFEVPTGEVRRWTKAENTARDMVYALSDELFWLFRKEDEYMSSVEQVREAAEANGYEYTVTGELATA